MGTLTCDPTSSSFSSLLGPRPPPAPQVPRHSATRSPRARLSATLRRNYKLQREPGGDGSRTGDKPGASTAVLGARRGQAAQARNLLCGWGRGSPRGTKAWVTTWGPPRDCFPRRNAHESAGHAARAAEGEAGSSEPMSPWGLPISLGPHLDACLGCTGWGIQAEGQAPLLCPVLVHSAWEPGGSLGRGDKAAAPPHLPALPLLTPGVHGSSI